jgi:hypothetical protein
MDCFTKWSEAYAIHNQEASTLVETLVTDFFCRSGVPLDIRSGQGRNSKSCLMQEVLHRVEVNQDSLPHTHTRNPAV